MSHSIKRFAKVPVLAFTCLALATACGKSSSKKAEPQLPLDKVQITGGVGQTHRLLVARPQAQLTLDKQDSLLQLDAEANIGSIKVLSTRYIAVESNSCADNVCTVTYRQSETAGEKDEIGLTLRILDTNGAEWKEVQALVPADPLEVSTLPGFTPNFGQVVSLTLPVSYKGRPNEIEPKLAQVQTTGGRIEAATCKPSSCQIDFKYESFNVQPTIRFALNDNTRLSKTYTITPQPETFNLIKRNALVVDGGNLLKIQKGVDYESSWNRPAHTIKVKGSSGLTVKPFACSADACVADVVVAAAGPAPLLEYSLQTFGSESAVNSLELTRTKPTFKGLLQEAFIEYGKTNLITLRPGQDYEASSGVLPTGLRIKDASWTSTITDARCDVDGVCSFNLKQQSNSAFSTLEYAFLRGNHESQLFTLKIRPYVAVPNTDISVWKKRADEWSEIVLEPGENKGYTSADGQAAQTIIVKKADNLKFKDVPDVAAASESIFTCDAAGVCRAWVKIANPNAYHSFMSYAVRTADHVSPVAQRKVNVIGDSIHFVKVADEHAFRKVQILDASSNLYSFDLSFAHGVDYTSQFPATNMLVHLDEGETIAIDIPHEKEGNGYVIQCGEVCRMSGSFVSQNFHKNIRVAFRNDYTDNNYGEQLYLIEESHAGIFPDKDSYKTIPDYNGLSFTIKFEKGPGLGYVGEKLAKAVRFRKSQDLSFDQGSRGKDAFGDYWEFPCNEQGACTVQATVSDIYPTMWYYFVDANGQSSIQRSVTLATPETFAPTVSTAAAIQSEFVDLYVYSFPRTDKGTVELYGSQGEVLGTLNCETYTSRCSGRIKLPAPLNSFGDSLELGYRRKHDDQFKSDRGILKLTGAATYRLKKDLVKTAQKLDGRKFKFEVSQADLEALDTSPSRWPLDSTTTLSFDVNGIIISQKTCDQSKCEFTLLNVPDNVSRLRVGVIKPHEYFSSIFFLDSYLSLQLVQ